MKHLWKYTIAGLRCMLVLTVILGIAYPVVIWGIGQVVAPQQANGSLIVVNGHPVGSRLLGQQFTDPQWLWPRPSAHDYDAMNSGASNLGPNSPQLLDAINERKQQLAQANGVSPDDIPADALTGSASGLDPHISPAYAAQQVHRIAAARGVAPERVQAVVTAHTHGRLLGFLGEPVVNVTEVNVELAQWQ